MSSTLCFSRKIMLKKFDVVRVKALSEPEREYDGSESVKQAPRVGDEGAIVYVLSAEGLENKYLVEAVDNFGYTLWIAEFWENELEKLNVET